MKLYIFQSGAIKTYRHLIVECHQKNIPYEVPVLFFLIQHPSGYVLFDAGQSQEDIHTSKQLQERPILADYKPVISDHEYIVNQLEKIHLKPSDIRHVVLSHLHSDHVGGIREFPHATFYLNRHEMDRDKSGLANQFRWHLLEGGSDYDLFGDGKIKIVFTPGHSPGHQSLLITLDHSGPILLASDAVYTREILDGLSLPGVMHDKEMTLATIRVIRKMQSCGIRIIPGHDPLISRTLKFAPNYYD